MQRGRAKLDKGEGGAGKLQAGAAAAAGGKMAGVMVVRRAVRRADARQV
jgi:hypothetical protein